MFFKGTKKLLDAPETVCQGVFGKPQEVFIKR